MGVPAVGPANRFPPILRILHAERFGVKPRGERRASGAAPAPDNLTRSSRRTRSSGCDASAALRLRGRHPLRTLRTWREISGAMGAGRTGRPRSGTRRLRRDSGAARISRGGREGRRVFWRRRLCVLCVLCGIFQEFGRRGAEALEIGCWVLAACTFAHSTAAFAVFAPRLRTPKKPEEGLVPWR